MMITLDLVDEHVSQSEKPVRRGNAPIYGTQIGWQEATHSLALEHHLEIRRAAHGARLVSSLRSNNLPIELQRWIDQARNSVHTLAERYVQRVSVSR